MIPVAESVIKNPSPRYKTLVQGGITGNGTYAATTNEYNISEVIVYFFYGNKIRQSIVYTGDQIRGGLCFPDIYLAGARAYMDVRISGSTVTVSSYTADQILSNGSWLLAYK